MNKIHTFAICAYKESPHLEACIESLIKQSVKSEVIMCTSTPNTFIETLASKYNIPYLINPIQGGIGSDWNFAYKSAVTPLVTIAHQDDIYLPTYAEVMLQSYKKHKDLIIAYTDYKELRNDEYVEHNRLLGIKKVMNWPFRLSGLQDKKWIRKMVLSFGCPICCPSVTLNKLEIQGMPFNIKMKNSLDWEAWLRLAKQKGRYIYINEGLMAHRISELSETTQTIANGTREREDLEMLLKIWPKPLAQLIAALYKKAMDSNEL